MMTFKPGDLVVYTGTGKYSNPLYIQKPVTGCIYTVREVTEFGIPGIYLEELHNRKTYNALYGAHEVNFATYEFRPIRKHDISVLTEMLVTA